MAKPRSSPESFYSYSAKRNLRKEEVAAYKRIALATVIIVSLLAAAYFVGVPFIARMGGDDISLTDKNKLGTTDNIPPTSPKLEALPEAVRSRTLTIKGSAESNSTVKISNNDKEVASFLVDKDGLFQGTIELETGDNSLTAVAVDAAGNSSRATKAITVTFDATAPRLSLSVELPATTDKNSVTIKGRTEAGSEVTINGRSVILADDNSFDTSLNLTKGSNTITIIATDKAGNSSRINRTVIYEQPESSSSASIKD